MALKITQISNNLLTTYGFLKFNFILKKKFLKIFTTQFLAKTNYEPKIVYLILYIIIIYNYISKSKIIIY